MLYYKRCFGTIQKGAGLPSWVQWTHHSEGETHCEECLMLDGCWFLEGKAPPCPHHPYCLNFRERTALKMSPFSLGGQCIQMDKYG